MRNIKTINFLPILLRLTVCFSFAQLLYPSISFGKVDPQNYNFSLDQLADFGPDKTMEEIQSKFGKGDPIFKDAKTQTLKFYMTHIRYRFPVFVTFFESKSIGYFARLPSYFLHDVFHQSLINRFEKQDIYTKKDNAAVYIWKNEKGVRYTYQGQCTITCFPMYLQMEKLELPQQLKENPSLLKKAYEKFY